MCVANEPTNATSVVDAEGVAVPASLHVTDRSYGNLSDTEEFARLEALFRHEYGVEMPDEQRNTLRSQVADSDCDGQADDDVLRYLLVLEPSDDDGQMVLFRLALAFCPQGRWHDVVDAYVDESDLTRGELEDEAEALRGVLP